MSVVTVSGTLDEVYQRLLSIRNVVNRRNVEGYPLWSQYEEWQYFTRPDLGEVCPVCAQYDQQVFKGNEVKDVFPYVEAWSEFYEAFPRTHMPDLSRFKGEPCHCELKLLNPVEAFEAQLHRDKEATL